ncbi:hypothetical protein [Methanothrix sp.]
MDELDRGRPATASSPQAKRVIAPPKLMLVAFCYQWFNHRPA